MNVREIIKQMGQHVSIDAKHMVFLRDGKQVKVLRKKTVKTACAFCQGTGIVSQYGHVQDGQCFTCKGTGVSKKTVRSLEDELEYAYLLYKVHNNFRSDLLEEMGMVEQTRELFKEARENGYLSVFDFNK